MCSGITQHKKLWRHLATANRHCTQSWQYPPSRVPHRGTNRPPTPPQGQWRGRQRQREVPPGCISSHGTLHFGSPCPCGWSPLQGAHHCPRGRTPYRKCLTVLVVPSGEPLTVLMGGAPYRESPSLSSGEEPSPGSLSVFSRAEPLTRSPSMSFETGPEWPHISDF